MAVEVDYVQFSGGANANVLAPAAYQARGEVQTGVQPGVADDTLANTAWRQATMGTAALANLIAQTLNVNVLDDGNLQNFVQLLKSTVATFAVTSVSPLYIGQDTSSTANNIVAIVAPAFTGTPTVGGLFVLRINNTITGPSQVTLNGGQTYPLVRGQGSATQGGEAFAGDFAVTTFNGAAFQIINDRSVTTSITYSPTTVQQLQQTIVALATSPVASNAIVTIQLPPGQLNLTSITQALSFAHACGLQIHLVGAPLKAAIPTAAQLQASSTTGLTNAQVLSVLNGVFATNINTVGCNALEVRGFLGSVQNILFTGDATASGGHYGALVGNWSTSVPATGATQFVNCGFHNFGLDNVRAEQGGFIQVNNCLSTYSTAHGYHISHNSSLECNTGNVLSMYNTQGVALQNQGLFAVDSASGTCDLSFNSVAGINGLGGATVNLNPATGIRIQNNKSYGITSAFLCNIALSSNGSTTFSGNGQDINVSNVANVLTFGCSLPSGSSPSRGSTGNNGATVY